MSQSRTLCWDLGSKEKAVDWRPRAQHALYSQDSHFDSRFSAYLRCESCLNDVYFDVLHKMHAPLIDAIAEVVSGSLVESATSGAAMSGAGDDACSKLPVSCITTGLGGSDSKIVVDSMIQRLEQMPTGGAVIDCFCHNTSSAHDLLTEIAENLRNSLMGRDLLGGRESKRQATTAQDLLSSSLLEKDGMVQTISRMPLEAIAELLFQNPDTCSISPHGRARSGDKEEEDEDEDEDEGMYGAGGGYEEQKGKSSSSSSSGGGGGSRKERREEESASAFASAGAGAGAGGVLGLVIVLRHTEHVMVEIFDHLVQALSQLWERRVSVHLVAVNTALAPLPLQLDKASRALIDVRIFGTLPPWRVYDTFMAKVVSSRQIPVSLPPSLWTWINEIFWRSNCSLRSALDMVLLALSHHFHARRSLLCMFEEHQFLIDMKLAKKAARSKKGGEDKDEYYLGQILAYMGGDDIEGTGLRLGQATARSSVANLAETRYAKQLLSSSLARQRADRAWFKCLRAARETALFPVQLRREFPSDLLWAACKSPVVSPSGGGGGGGGDDGLYDSTVGAMLLGLQASLPLTPINEVHALIVTLQGLLADLPACVEMVYDVHLAEQEADGQGQGQGQGQGREGSGAGTLVDSATKGPLDGWNGPNGAPLTAEEWVCARATSVQAVQTLLDDLADHYLVWQEYVAMLGDEGYGADTSYQALFKRLSSRERDRDRDSERAQGQGQGQVGKRTAVSSSGGPVTAGAGPTAGVPGPGGRGSSLFPSPAREAGAGAGADRKRKWGDADAPPSPLGSAAAAAAASVPASGTEAVGSPVSRRGTSTSTSTSTGSSTGTGTGTGTPPPSQSSTGAAVPPVQVQALKSPASGSRLVGHIRSPSPARAGAGAGAGGSPYRRLRLQSPLRSSSSSDGTTTTATTTAAAADAAVDSEAQAQAQADGQAADPQAEAEEPGLEFEFIGIAIEDLLQWLTHAAQVLRSLRRPRALAGILDLDEGAMRRTLEVAGANLRATTMRGLNDPDYYLQAVDASSSSSGKDKEGKGKGKGKGKKRPAHAPSTTMAEHDVNVLARIVFESLSSANIYDWFDKFREDCEEWHPLTTAGTGAGAHTEQSFDFTSCRFVRALSDLESTGLVRVRSGGGEVQRITYLWMGNTAGA